MVPFPEIVGIISILGSKVKARGLSPNTLKALKRKDVG